MKKMKIIIVYIVAVTIFIGTLYAQTPKWVSTEAQNRIAVLEAFTGMYCQDCHDGHRIGYGGGYYDRFIRKMQNNMIQEINKFIELKTVAVGYDIQIVEKVPMGAYDIRPDIVITENRMI